MAQKAAFFALTFFLLFGAGCSDDSGSGTVFEVVISNTSAPAAGAGPVLNVFSPALWAVHESGQAPLYTLGAPASNELEAFAEDSDATLLSTELVNEEGVTLVGAVSQNTVNESLLGPGQSYRFLITAFDNSSLSLAMAYLQANDTLVATPAEGIPLFDANGDPQTGDVTSQFLLLDAGTEVNQPPGAGADQLPRQTGPNTGAAQGGVVSPLADNSVPPVAAMLRITITPVRDDLEF